MPVDRTVSRTLLYGTTIAWEDVIISGVRKVSVMQSPDSSHTTVVADTYSGTASDIKGMAVEFVVNHHKKRYPCCIVWTPIPLLTWLFPFIGHMGIAMSSGIIRDFAGPYFVSEDNMAFGSPTKYWQLQPHLARGGQSGWDCAVTEASEEYKTRMHNLCCDNCHSHVAMALNLMHYDGSDNWNMLKLAFLMLLKGRYVSVGGFLRTWVPFLLPLSAVVLIYLLL